jgi:hypothetical protein
MFPFVASGRFEPPAGISDVGFPLQHAAEMPVSAQHIHDCRMKIRIGQSWLSSLTEGKGARNCSIIIYVGKVMMVNMRALDHSSIKFLTEYFRLDRIYS